MWWVAPLVHTSGALFAQQGFLQGNLPVVEIRCRALTREQVSEIEARARADLMTSGVSVLEAILDCSSDRVTVTVSSESVSIEQTAARYTHDVREALIEALDTALLRLMHPEHQAVLPAPHAPAPSAAAESESAPAASGDGPALASAEDASAPTRSAPVTPTRSDVLPRPEAASVERRSSQAVDVGAGPLGEWWQGSIAAGASLDAGYGSPLLSLRLQFGALTQVQQAGAFDALELSAAIGVRTQPGWAQGGRLSASIGASWLDIAPRRPFEPRGGTDVWAGFAALELSRPVWFGSWSLVPSARVRLFAGERRVILDGHTELAIRRLAPGLAVALAHTFE
jgi:hypothetical protein